MFKTYATYDSQQLASGHDIQFALPWIEELTLQNEDLDTDHRALLDKLNNLLFALSCSDLDRINPALAVLASEAEAHFATEKELMLAVDYPGRESHVEKHGQLLQGIRQIGFTLTSGQISLSSVHALSMLELWFVPHLTHTDRQFADFIAARSAALNAS